MAFDTIRGEGDQIIDEDVFISSDHKKRLAYSSHLS